MASLGPAGCKQGAEGGHVRRPADPGERAIAAWGGPVCCCLQTEVRRPPGSFSLNFWYTLSSFFFPRKPTCCRDLGAHLLRPRDWASLMPSSRSGGLPLPSPGGYLLPLTTHFSRPCSERPFQAGPSFLRSRAICSPLLAVCPCGLSGPCSSWPLGCPQASRHQGL